MSVSDSYHEALSRRGFEADPAQQRAVLRLQELEEGLIGLKAARSNTIKRLISHPDIPRGVYLWGGVGRGKSFLMDAFYSSVPIKRKTRIHFHEFMRGVHRELDEIKGIADPLDAVASRLAKRYRLICFDEFHVSDIADAMILYRLLAPMFALGVVFVMTSNFRPDDLYPDGLHRDRMLAAIELLNGHLDVLNVDSGVDYRKRSLEQVSAYLCPLGPETDAALGKMFDLVADTADQSPLLNIEAREVQAMRRAGACVWFSFQVLCGGPRSQNDYLELASRFQTIFVSDVPQMSAGMASEARRFTWLVDVLYDHRVKLILSAQVAVEELYTAGALAGEFQRTVSRIVEMQSREYLQSERRSALADF